MLQYNGIKNDVIVPENVYEIADNAFSTHREIMSITFNSSIYYVGSYAFSGCVNLLEINGLDEVSKVGEYAFNDTLWYKNLSGEVKMLNNTAIGSDTTKKEITLPDNTLSIAPKAFYENETLKTINFNKNLSDIGNYAFYGCTSLETINLSENIQHIGYNAFTLTPWIEGHTEEFVIINDILIKYTGDNSIITLPATVKQIGAGAFYGNNSIEEVIPSNGLYYIGESAFENSTLKSIDLSVASVVYIGKNAFKNCLGLESILLDSKVKYIGKDAFFACSNLLAKVSVGTVAFEYVTQNEIDYILSGVMGDIDNDGVLSMTDVVMLQKYIAKLISEDTFNKSIADIDGSGKIDMQDVTFMQKRIAKLL